MFILKALKAYAQTDRVALVNRSERLTFAQLDARSDAFAAWLLEHCASDRSARSPVVIYGHKETDFLPCVFGALKAGRAYVPMDISVPLSRAEEIIAEVGPAVVVNFTGLPINTTADMLPAAELDSILSSRADFAEEYWVSGDDISYILFTSGSTGRPKGVPITAGNLTNFHDGLLPFVGEGGVVLNQISYSFDLSCCPIYIGLARGMTLFTVDNDTLADMAAFYDHLRSSGLTMWVSTPSFAELCVRSRQFSAELLPGLKQFLFCGEVLTNKLCNQLAERFPAAEILNTYGPTEATVLISAVRVTEQMRHDTLPVPIGRPLDEVQLRLADSDGNTMEHDNAEGEMLIISSSVSPGYLNRPDLTADRFFTDSATGKRGYRTGDLCYRKNGLYYYQGRVDNQLKLSGHRIELEDIEANLARVNNISRAAVIPVWEGQQVQYLVAFLMLEADDGLAALTRSIAIKKQLAELLPAYMVPRKFVVVDTLPLNANDKVDRQALARRLEGTT